MVKELHELSYPPDLDAKILSIGRQRCSVTMMRHYCSDEFVVVGFIENSVKERPGLKHGPCLNRSPACHSKWGR
jgi:hypothetical protein